MEYLFVRGGVFQIYISVSIFDCLVEKHAIYGYLSCFFWPFEQKLLIYALKTHTQKSYSKIRELEKKAELQNVLHEELVLEMAAIKRSTKGGATPGQQLHGTSVNQPGLEISPMEKRKLCTAWLLPSAYSNDVFFSVLVAAPKQLTLERQLNKSILIGWNPPDTPSPAIDCYHVYVDRVLKVTVKAIERTRALVEASPDQREICDGKSTNFKRRCMHNGYWERRSSWPNKRQGYSCNCDFGCDILVT
ncbi:unnamed protein product [Nesidiocoris tenuis]|uniref:Fibronectin type-III domain-containing protein n=1 Tax=Nesidiocoris tenuis TaxID=355587 RepID=A0A6H5HRP4_9HEMI|nr:unnamed protein product [Nesidiocoris tenuis]